MSTSDDDLGRDDTPVPGHPATDDSALSAGEEMSGGAWRSGGVVESMPPDRERDDAVVEHGCDDPPRSTPAGARPARREPPADEPDLAEDLAQFLDVEPPESPAADSDAPAPG